MNFTIGRTTYTDDPKQARKAPEDGAAGPFVASDDAALYTMGPYAHGDQLEIKIPGRVGASIAVAPGVFLILGGQNTGKSYLGDAIAALNDFPRVTFEEPVPGALVGEKALAAAMLATPTLGAHGVVLDSIRTLFYTATGNTGRGGINMSLYAMLTQWDIWAKSHSKVLFAVLNPIQTDEAVLEAIREAGMGSVETFGYLPRKGTLEYSTRSAGRDMKTVSYPVLTAAQKKSESVIFASAPMRSSDTNGVSDILALFTTLQPKQD